MKSLVDTDKCVPVKSSEHYIDLCFDSSQMRHETTHNSTYKVFHVVVVVVVLRNFSIVVLFRALRWSRKMYK